MKQRIITSIVACAVLIPVLIFADTPALPVGIALCAVIGVYEMLACVGLKQSLAISAPLYLCAGAFPLLARYIKDLSLFTDVAFAALSVCLLYLFAVLIFSHGKYTVQAIGSAFFSILYMIMGFTSIILIHDREIGGEFIYLTIFIGAWITDIFAYFCGILFGRGGKHKLIPDVSPKKTVEGSIGGIAFCVLSMVAFGLIIDAVSDYHANLLLFAIAGLAVSIVAQVGDLAMSVIKRTYGIKDYGKLFPGHGGVLDRFDSILAVSVVLMVFTKFFDLLTIH